MPGKKEAEALRREQIMQAAFQVAAREGLEQLTIRLVAQEAGLSTGLVFFHFKSKQALLLALLNQLLDTLFERWEVSERLPPAKRLLALIQLDMQDIYQSEEAGTTLELFFTFWVMYSHDSAISERMQHAIERARQAFLPTIQALIESEPERFRNVTPEAFVTVILSITQGYAIQTLLNKPSVDVEQILSVIRALLMP